MAEIQPVLCLASCADVGLGPSEGVLFSVFDKGEIRASCAMPQLSVMFGSEPGPSLNKQYCM